jgi:hypothetical protein
VTRYVSLAEYLWLVEQVTGIDANTLAKISRVELADSALHAPSAGFGDQAFYPDLIDKAAVLTCRLAWNHPLLDGGPKGRHRPGREAHAGPQRTLTARSGCAIDVRWRALRHLPDPGEIAPDQDFHWVRPSQLALTSPLSG